MHGLNHVHVLALIGVCVDSDMEQTSPLIVLPYMDNGDLRSFLRDGNNVRISVTLNSNAIRVRGTNFSVTVVTLCRESLEA